MLNLRQILKMRCEEASRLGSEGLDRRLTLSEKMGVAAHLAICASCRRFRRQLALVQQWAQQALNLDPASEAIPPAKLSEHRRALIKQALRENAP